MIIVVETNSVLDTLDIDYCNMGPDFLGQETTEEESVRFFENNISGNTKVFPGGPVCCVGGKNSPPFVTCSTSGNQLSEAHR